MRGHEKLIALRKAGKRPAFVFLNDFACDTDWFDAEDRYATVSVAGDCIERLDLRFLVGLSVSASGATEERAKALLQACKRAGAALVGACHVTRPVDSGWAEVWRKPIEDEGVCHA